MADAAIRARTQNNSSRTAIDDDIAAQVEPVDPVYQRDILPDRQVAKLQIARVLESAGQRPRDGPVQRAGKRKRITSQKNVIRGIQRRRVRDAAGGAGSAGDLPRPDGASGS